MNYEIRKNEQFNSLEILFDGKPSAAIRDALKSHKFRWHGVKKLWYGKAEEAVIRAAIDGAGKTTESAEAESAAITASDVNKYGVRVGDLFYASWGYDETHVSFFQVVALVGACSVRVREVSPVVENQEAVSSMSADVTYQTNTHGKLLPVRGSSVFIDDQEHGDLKRLKSYYADESKPCFKLSSFAFAYICTGDTKTLYNSWYR